MLKDLIHIRCVHYCQAFYRVKSYSVRFADDFLTFRLHFLLDFAAESGYNIVYKGEACMYTTEDKIVDGLCAALWTAMLIMLMAY